MNDPSIPPGDDWPIVAFKDRAKLERQMTERGWTYGQIGEAVPPGERFGAVNNETGRVATRYVHPRTGRSVVIDNETDSVIMVGGNGFRF